MTAEVFVDTGAVIAFLDRSDGLHEDAVALFARPPARWCTSALVIAEAHGWFLHRLGEERARLFRRFVAELPRLRMLHTSPRHLQAVEAKLDARRGCKLTYVDASSLVWIEEREITTVWGTDHDLGIEGATVTPGSRVR